jgi:hypothetical protein
MFWSENNISPLSRHIVFKLLSCPFSLNFSMKRDIYYAYEKFRPEKPEPLNRGGGGGQGVIDV